jgi:hypothetical protein
MGSTASTPLQQEEKRQRELMERIGVLIPPSFGVGTEGLPPSAIALKQPSPSLIYSLEQESTCYRLLNEHLTPGLWLSASTPYQASVLASFYVKNDSNQGMLSASQQFANNTGSASIRAYTSQEALIYGEYSPTSYMNLSGNVDETGKAWLGCNVSPTDWWRAHFTKPKTQQYYRNDPFANEEKDSQSSSTVQNVQLGTFVKMQQASNSSKSPVQVDSILGQASLQLADCTVAMETKVPLETLEPQVSYHISANLNGQGGPPLIVSMLKTPTRSSMNLSQVATFDRLVVNALEVRCPKIRNSFGWAVQMEKQHDQEHAQFMAGLAWQMNRGIGIKVVAKNNGGVTAALLLKRWKQPRVLCSLLAGTSGPGKDIQLGISLELETGPSPLQDFYNDTEERRVDDEVPVTKATIPDNISGI